MKNLVLLFSILMVGVFGSCRPMCCAPPPEPNPIEAMEILNISYGTSAYRTMDVYLPKGRSLKTPVLIFLHGGGFAAGDKNEVTEQVKAFRDRGFAVINLNYRLVDTTGLLSLPPTHQPSSVKLTDQIGDVTAAINVAKRKTREWSVSSRAWAIAGHSAGGTIALMYAYSDDNADRKIQAVGNFAGVTNFAFDDESDTVGYDPRWIELLYRTVGFELKNENKLAYMAASPFWQAFSKKNVVPTINIRPEFNIISGVPDTSPQQYLEFTNLLNSNEVINKYVIVATADHGFGNGTYNQVYDDAAAFFKANLKE